MNATYFYDYGSLNISDADFVDDHIVNYTIVEDVMIFLSGVVSVACVCAMCAAWALLPGWRSLQAYITINETIFGTLSNILFDEYFHSLENLFGCGCRKFVSERIAARLLLLSVCWSLCASVVAYVKLVRVAMVRSSHEKKAATGAACGLWLVGLLADWCYGDGSIVLLLILFVILFLILTIFVVICVSVLCCWCDAPSNRSWTHVVALAGVGLICQSMTLVYVFVIAGIAIADINVSFHFTYALFLYRFVPSSLVLLLNKNTRILWKRYAQQKRNRDACREFHL